MPLALSTYRDRLEEMTAEALDEYYRHAAGLKPTLEMTPIYARYADLSSLEQVRALDAAGAHRELRRFACEAFVGNGVKELTDQAANRESELEIEWNGGRIPYRAVRPTLMNEPDATRRRDLHARRCAATEEHLNPLLAEIAERERELTREAGASTVLALYEGFGYDPAGLHAQTQAFLDETEPLYRRRMDALLRERLGMGLDEAAPPDLARLLRAPEFDAGFRPDQALPALRATLADLGIDLDAQGNVELDVEARPNKRPRAFCAPVRVPGRVVLVILPQGGQDDYRALFHEAGHTEHFAHTAGDLPAEQRILGDNGVTEGFAFLLEHLAADAAWLADVLGIADPAPVHEHARATRLLFLRRYCAKLAYELELHESGELDAMREVYVSRLSAAVHVDWPAATWLSDVDPFFYAARYLRAWAFETHLRTLLRERFGERWFAEPEAGAVLRGWWSRGQASNADDLLEELTGERLDFGVLLRDLAVAT
jgi:hypothetical protein